MTSRSPMRQLGQMLRALDAMAEPWSRSTREARKSAPASAAAMEGYGAWSRKRSGPQRFRCPACGRTFSAAAGTLRDQLRRPGWIGVAIKDMLSLMPSSCRVLAREAQSRSDDDLVMAPAHHQDADGRRWHCIRSTVLRKLTRNSSGNLGTDRAKRSPALPDQCFCRHQGHQPGLSHPRPKQSAPSLREMALLAIGHPYPCQLPSASDPLEGSRFESC